jgi:flagellar motor switch protein FliG
MNGTFGARQKAAALVLALGTEKARGLLSHLSEGEVKILAAEIAKLEDVAADQRDGVYRETLENASRAGIHGGMDRAKELLSQFGGAGGANFTLDDSITGQFGFLTSMGDAAGQILMDEHPQVIAAVLSETSPEHSSRIIKALPEQMRSEISFRLATIGEVEPDTLDAIKAALKQRVKAPSSRAAAIRDGAKSLAEILNAGTKDEEEAILGFMDQQDKEVADRVRALMFVFEDIVDIDDRGIQGILKNLDTKTLALALKGTSEAVQSRITSNLSERAKAALLEEIDLMGPVRRSEVEEAQAECVAQIRMLEDSGELVLDRGGNDELIS